jgi:hypothetical protein
MPLAIIRGPNGNPVYIDVSPIPPQPTQTIVDLPIGAEPTGIAAGIKNSISELKDLIATAIALGADTLAQHKPAEWKLEFDVGFAGEVNPIPFIASSKANACLKITAVWKKNE